MACPDFQTLMLPTLKLAATTPEIHLRDLRDRIAKELALSAADLEELIPSGRQTRFHNRVNWAATYLAKAGLMEAVRRGVYRVTSAGRDLLKSPPPRIDIGYLNKHSVEFQAWEAGTAATALPESPAAPGTPPSPPPSEATPEEQMEAGYQSLRRGVEADLLARIMASSPTFFEEIVVRLLVAMGYGGSLQDAGKALGRSGDGGIDGIIKEDRLGLDAIYIQAKRWDPSTHKVSRPAVQAFAGSLEGVRARKGVFITTSSFTSEAKEYVKIIEKKIVLIDGELLTSLLFEHGVGVRTKYTYEIKEIDEDTFSEE